jgi:putative sigma-54 modulation protein
MTWLRHVQLSKPVQKPCFWLAQKVYTLIHWQELYKEQETNMAMQIDIYTQNLELTPRIDGYVRNKIDKLDRLLKGIDECRIDLSHVKSARSAADRNVAQITIRGKGFILRSEERSDDVYSAFDATMDKIQRQIERFKGKRIKVRATGSYAEHVAATENEEAEATTEEPVIARRKQFTLVPMDEMEAIEQMTLLGHENFFIFFNVNTNSINVLYRRRNGDYGLIEPKIG